MFTDASGTTIHRRVFDAFGEVFAETSNPTQTTAGLFTGHRFEAAVGMYNAGARWYDPGTGRFASIDPIVQRIHDPQTLNPYTYTRNNPVSLVDPSGFGFLEALGGFGLILFGALLGGLAGRESAAPILRAGGELLGRSLGQVLVAELSSFEVAGAPQNSGGQRSEQPMESSGSRAGESESSAPSRSDEEGPFFNSSKEERLLRRREAAEEDLQAGEQLKETALKIIQNPELFAAEEIARELSMQLMLQEFSEQMAAGGYDVGSPPTIGLEDPIERTQLKGRFLLFDAQLAIDQAQRRIEIIDRLLGDLRSARGRRVYPRASRRRRRRTKGRSAARWLSPTIAAMALGVLLGSLGCQRHERDSRSTISGELRFAPASSNPVRGYRQFEVRDLAGATRSYYVKPETVLSIGPPDVSRVDLVRHETPSGTTRAWSALVVLTTAAQQRLEYLARGSSNPILVTAGSDVAIGVVDPKEIVNSEGKLVFFLSDSATVSAFRERVGLLQTPERSDAAIDSMDACRTAAGDDDTLLADCLRTANRAASANKQKILDSLDEGLQRGTISTEDALDQLEALERQESSGVGSTPQTTRSR